jgi:hypothetical protein
MNETGRRFIVYGGTSGWLRMTNDPLEKGKQSFKVERFSLLKFCQFFGNRVLSLPGVEQEASSSRSKGRR